MAGSAVKIGFVGVGGMGQMAHLRNFVDVDGAEVVAVSDLQEDKAELVAQRYGVPRFYGSHRAMLDAEQLDAVVASQPFHMHAALLPDLYPEVRYLFTEKPLAVLPEAGEALASQAADAGCTHMVGYHKRSDPATAEALRVIDQWKQSGDLGAMTYVRLVMPPGDWVADGMRGRIDVEGGPTPPSSGETRPDDMSPELYGAYVDFVNYYIHQVNLMRYLLGEDYDLDYVDPAGRLMVAHSSSGTPAVLEMATYHTTIDWNESAEVYFERGYVKLSLPAPLAHNRPGRLEVFRDPGAGQQPQTLVPTLPWKHAMLAQAENFVKVCRGERTPPCDAAEAVQDLQIARNYIRMLHGA